MPGFNPFDMDLDGDVDGIDFLGFDYFTRYVSKLGEPQDAYDECQMNGDDWQDTDTLDGA